MLIAVLIAAESILTTFDDVLQLYDLLICLVYLEACCRVSWYNKNKYHQDNNKKKFKPLSHPQLPFEVKQACVTSSGHWQRLLVPSCVVIQHHVRLRRHPVMESSHLSRSVLEVCQAVCGRYLISDHGPWSSPSPVCRPVSPTSFQVGSVFVAVVWVFCRVWPLSGVWVRAGRSGSSQVGASRFTSHPGRAPALGFWASLTGPNFTGHISRPPALL